MVFINVHFQIFIVLAFDLGSQIHFRFVKKRYAKNNSGIIGKKTLQI